MLNSPAMRLGVCYYPEHWPESWWAEDAKQMIDLGISQVRIAEFAWSRIEPQPEQFQWDWLDRAIDTLADAGLSVVMCTPTATPPKWLIDEHPDMLAVGADGRPRAFGSRRHYDFSSDVYLECARRITTLVAERYGAHEAVHAWQTDNEYGCHDTVVSYSANAVRRFRLWCQQRYRTIEALNEAWGNVFWSMEYAGFDEIDAPIATVTEANPAHRFDYRRFASDEVVRFNRMQCEILRLHSPGRPISHNFMLFFTEFDHHKVAADLDVVTWDSYPIGALENFWFAPAVKNRWLRTGHPDFAGFHHDLYRGMSRQPFWVMEQQPGPVNWARYNPAPAPGMVRLWTWEAFAHGADVVSYFRWRQAPFAQEQMHAGLHAPDRTLALGGREAHQVSQEMLRVPVQACGRASVALVFDYEARWLTQVHPHGEDFDYLRQAFDLYSMLRSLAFDVDIVSPHASLEGYRLIVVPSQPIVPADFVRHLKASAAQIVLLPRCGSKVETVRIPPALPPGPLAAILPLRVVSVESLRPTVVDPVSYEGRRHGCGQWREHLEHGHDVLAEAQFEDGGTAVARHGRVRYLAGVFDEAMQRALLAQAARDAGLEPAPLPEGLRVRRRGELLFVFNYNDNARELHVPDAQWLIGGMTVAAHGVSVARHLRASG
jgi:beta-galactosidase